MSLQFHGALALKSTMIILSFPSKLILVTDSMTSRSLINILWRRQGKHLGAGNFFRQIPLRKWTSSSRCRWEIHYSNSIILEQIWCGTKTISNIINSMVMFPLSTLDWKYPFCENVVQKPMVFSLFLICCFHWWCSFFLFSTVYPFWGIFGTII